MKIAYVDFYGISKTDNPSSGVERKIASHIKMLGTIGQVTRHSYDTETSNRLLKISRMITRRLPFFPSKIVFTFNEEYENLDALYFRRTTLDSFAIRFFRDVKKHNPRCKIVMELPTYPYDKEMTSFIELPRLIKDRWNRRKLKLYIDRIVTFSDDDEIFGIPTIKTMNGIDFEMVPIRMVQRKADDAIHAIMVANFASWHGLDKLIGGMISYYAEQQNRLFVLHVVGGGKVVKEEMERVANSIVRNYVEFHGPLWGQALQEVYDRVTLAIDICDIEEHGIFLSSSLKTREYVAQGLPVVGAIEIDLSRSMKEYFYLFKNVHDINIHEIIKFHDTIYHDESDYHTVPAKIRALAKTVCDIPVVMDPILEYFKSN